MRIRSLFVGIGLLSLATILFGCQNDEPSATSLASDSPQGRVMLWTADGPDAATWNSVLSHFNQIYPDVDVLHTRVPPDQLRDRYERATQMGLGPDLLVGPSGWALELAEADALRPLSLDELRLGRFLSVALETLTVGEQLYGLPLSLDHNALYYNVDMVEMPATTLDELLAHAEAGQAVAMPIAFQEAFWGVQAFGGALLDDDGQLAIQDGGMLNWLSWLQAAQSAPGMILNHDKVALRDLFTSEEVAYYIGRPSELAMLVEALGDEKVGVAVLPKGPQGLAGPLLSTEAVLFNPRSSVPQSQLAHLLGTFLSNAEQGATFMRETQRVPANTDVRVDARINPRIAGFATQAATAVAIPNTEPGRLVMTNGELLFQSVLSGVNTPTEAVADFTKSLNEQLGRPPDTFESVPCGPEGDVEIWHDLPESVIPVLADIANNYSAGCPGSAVQLQTVPAAEMQQRLSELDPDQRPALVIASSFQAQSLADAELIHSIDNLLEPEVSQRFIPGSLVALQYQEKLYGVPLSLAVNTLYYDALVVQDAPASLDALVVQAESGQTFVFPVNAVDAFWGVSAFSEYLVDEEGRVFTDITGLIGWLEWLATNQNEPGMRIVAGHQSLPAMIVEEGEFSESGFSYGLGRAEDLYVLQTVTDSENLRAATLPSGPAGPGRPLLFVQSFLVSGDSPESRAAGVAFATYATNRENQTNLMYRSQLVPANVNVMKEDFPDITVMTAQAQEAVILPPGFSYELFVGLGDQMYQDVLGGDSTAVDAACNYVVAINQAAGVEMSREELGDVCAPTE